MSYFGFLALFVVIPIIGLLLWLRFDGGPQPPTFHNYPAWVVVLGIVVVAVIYTTPWDNYLVATRVWWYDPDLVTGIVLGYVPIEEYTFFVLQPILTGLWLLWLMRRMGTGDRGQGDSFTFRRNAVLAVGVVWVVMALLLFFGPPSLTYLSITLSWALLPIMLQLAFGADILWRNRVLVGLAIAVPTLYLSAADAVAINSGTWTIDPAQSLHWLLFGILPIEEFVFFLITNTLVAFGCTLVLATDSQTRLDGWLAARKLSISNEQ